MMHLESFLQLWWSINQCRLDLRSLQTFLYHRDKLINFNPNREHVNTSVLIKGMKYYSSMVWHLVIKID